MRVAGDLNPEALRRPQSKNKVCTDKEFVEAVLSPEGKTFTNIVSEAKVALQMSPRTTATDLKRLVGKGLIQSSGGLYWTPVQ